MAIAEWGKHIVSQSPLNQMKRSIVLLGFPCSIFFSLQYCLQAGPSSASEAAADGTRTPLSAVHTPSASATAATVAAAAAAVAASAAAGPTAAASGRGALANSSVTPEAALSTRSVAADTSRQSRTDLSAAGSVAGRENGGGSAAPAGGSKGLEEMESVVVQQVMRKIVDEGLLAAAAAAAVKAGQPGRGTDGKSTPQRDDGLGMLTTYFVSDNASIRWGGREGTPHAHCD